MAANSVLENATVLPFEEAWQRAQRLLRIKTQRELAQALGINESNITQAKKRGTWPLEWAVYLARNFNLSLDELVFGLSSKEDQSSQISPQRKPIYIDSAVELVEEALKATGREINSEQKSALVSIIREELKRKTENLVSALTS